MRRGHARRAPRRYAEDSYEAQLAARRERQRDRNRQMASRAHGPARTVLETAMRLIEQGRAVKGSCYDYIDAVFKAAGHDDWRRRETIYRKPKKGPYVNLDRVEPGDWLWVVKSPRGARIKTHSVLFVAWEDRSRGLAYVVDHPGQGRAVSGRYRTYDVSRTYNITRPTETRTGRTKTRRKKNRKRRTASLRR